MLTSKKSSLDLALNQGIKTKFVIEAKASFTVLYPTIVTSLAHCHSSVLKLNVTAAEIMSKLNDASSLALLVLLNYIDDKTTITAIEHKAVRGLMLVSKTSKADLRIRHAEIHPSLINSKKLIEGLSVKALLGKPFTAQGKHYLDFLLDNPSSDPKEIKKRLDFIEALLSCDKSRLLAFRTFSRQVKEFAKMKIALDSFSKSLLIWHNLKTSASMVLMMMDQIKIALKLNNCAAIESTLTEVSDVITNCIDFSNGNDCPRIKEGLHSDLDNLRKQYSKIDDFLSKKANLIRSTIPKNSLIQRFSLNYLQQYGYLLCVEKDDNYYSCLNFQEGEIDNMEETNLLKEFDFAALNLEFQFHDEYSICFKNAVCEEIDNEIGDIGVKICDLENLIFLQIAEKLDAILTNALEIDEFVGLIDGNVQLAGFCYHYSMVRPSFVENDTISLFNLRNLIRGKSAGNDIIIKRGRPLILTGDAGSGKSDLVATIGQTIYLAHIGCFVPCDKASLPPFDKLLTSVCIEESNLTNLSSFTFELMQLNQVLKSTEGPDINCLAIVDDPFRKTFFRAKFAFTKSLVNTFKESKVFMVVAVNRDIAEQLEEEQMKEMETVAKKDRKEFSYKMIEYSGKLHEGYFGRIDLSGFDPVVVAKAKIFAKKLQDNETIMQVVSKQQIERITSLIK